MTFLLSSLLMLSALTAQQRSTTDEPSVRHFQLMYSGTIKNLPADSKVRVWIPLAQDTKYQEVIQMKSQLPIDAVEHQESVHGNKMLYYEFAPEKDTDLPFLVSYDIRRSEVNSLAKDDSQVEPLTTVQRSNYLQANRLVPIDGRPITLLDGLTVAEGPMEAARDLYDHVDDYMTYDKSQPGYGNGDVLWACDSKTGNCTDFHSLFISFARNRGIPAHFEIGFPLPPERGEGKIGGYHCWANFFIEGKGWVPVDISEADKHPELKEYYFGNLTEDRVAFSKGRDITLSPKQAGPPLNYFVFPYVEVDGKPMNKDNFEMSFDFKDVKE